MNKHRIFEFLAGLLFGLGLIVSGMTDPGKVIGFLDLFGAWDPSLAFVMAGAVLVGIVAFAAAKKRTSTFLGSALRLPQDKDIDTRLIAGSVVFGQSIRRQDVRVERITRRDCVAVVGAFERSRRRIRLLRIDAVVDRRFERFVVRWQRAVLETTRDPDAAHSIGMHDERRVAAQRGVAGRIR
jgi:hypothetical protein